MAAAQATGGGSPQRAPGLPAGRSRIGGEAGLHPAPGAALLSVGRPGPPRGELTQLKLLCQGGVGERKLERVPSGLDLCSAQLEQKELDSARPGLPLRGLLASVRRRDLLRCLGHFGAGGALREG